MRFRVHAALHEESTSGWVWSKVDNVESRSLVRIVSKTTNKSVICEYREIDSFFLHYFNARRRDGSQEMTMVERPVVISSWYRGALGIKGIGHDVELNITPVRLRWLGSIQGGCQHPDVVVRLATRLGVLGVWLGLTSVMMSVLSFEWFRKPWLIAILLTAVIGAGILASVVCKGVTPPERQ